jgi:hypothetical protein
VVIRRITVVFVMSHFTLSIALLIRNGDAWPQGLAICNRKVNTTARLSLANVLADAYLDSLVSK